MLGVQTSQVYWHYVLVSMAPLAPCMPKWIMGLTHRSVLGVQTSQVYWHYVLVTMAPPAPCMLDVTVGLTDSNATADGNTKVKVGAV